MIVSEDHNEYEYVIRSYSPGEIIVNDQSYTRSLIICPDQLITDWPPQRWEQLTLADLQMAINLKPEVLLLGSGKKFQLLPQPLQTFINDNHLAVECMDTHAACRTYLALAAEDRRVVAALIIE